MKALKAILPLLLIASFLAFFSCGGRAASSDLERASLFEIPYGRFEGEIDLFSNIMEQTGGVCPEVCLYMRDGIFFVGNAASKKVLQLTSYGDLLSVYYNPEYSPAPDFHSTSAAQGDPSAGKSESSAGVMTQRAIEYPFNMISAVAADSQGRLYVADMLPVERVEYSEADELMLENIVIRFDAQGNFIDYLGQEGPGGTPFSALSGIYINSNNELFVVALRQDGTDVFWFSGAGRLLHKTTILNSSLPSPYTDGRRGFSSLSGIVPARQGGTVYLMIDYYLEDVDADTGLHTGIAFDSSALCPFSLQGASFGELISLPSYEIPESAPQGSRDAPVKKPYSIIGIAEGNRAFLYTPVREGFEVCIVDLNSKRVRRRALNVSLREQVYNVFHLSDDGILSALLAGQDKAQVVWWRTDTHR